MELTESHVFLHSVGRDLLSSDGRDEELLLTSGCLVRHWSGGGVDLGVVVPTDLNWTSGRGRLWDQGACLGRGRGGGSFGRWWSVLLLRDTVEKSASVQHFIQGIFRQWSFYCLNSLNNGQPPNIDRNQC